MSNDIDFLYQFKESFFSYTEKAGKTIRLIPSTDYDDVLNYIRFDEVLQKLASKDLSIDKKKDSLKKFLNTKNIYLWFWKNHTGVAMIPHGAKPLDELLPYNDKKYSPYVNAYLRWLANFSELELDHIFQSGIKNLALSPNAIANEDVILKSLVDALQSEETTVEVKKAIKAFHRTNRDLKKYVESLIAYKANLLLIRLDLAFNKDYLDTQKKLAYDKLSETLNDDVYDDTDTRTFYEKRLDIESSLIASDLKTIKDYRAKFFRIIKRKYDVKGFIWKLEYGVDKSFHYHCLLMLDGDKHREDISIAMDMGEMWKKLTHDESCDVVKGIYWNCNANKDKYKHLAIGQLNASNKTMIDNLFTYVLPYLAKTDYYFKLAKTNDRAIGMGNDKVKVKSGRPRKVLQPASDACS